MGEGDVAKRLAYSTMDRPFSLYKRHLVGKAGCHQPREPSTEAPSCFINKAYKRTKKQRRIRSDDGALECPPPE